MNAAELQTAFLKQIKNRCHRTWRWLMQLPSN